MVSVDSLIILGYTSEEMVENLDEGLERYPDRVLYVAAHECRSFATEMKWYGGLIYSGEGVTHDAERV